MGKNGQDDVALEFKGLVGPSYVVIVQKLIVIIFSDVHQVYF